MALEGRPYDIVLGRNGAQLYVSDWANRQILAIDTDSLRVVARIPVGEHPNQIVMHPKDDRLFVACASTNTVAVLETKRGVVTEIIPHLLVSQERPRGAPQMPSPWRRMARPSSWPTPTTIVLRSSMSPKRRRAM